MTTRPNVLLIDDDPVGTTAIKSILADEGYSVECASEGLAGLRLALTGRFRIVITDWVMPNLPGTELCRKLREAHLPSYVYILLLSQKSRTSDIVDGLNAGADDYLTKP